MENLIQNTTQGYGYKYATLGDYVKQGVQLPKMKTGTDANGKDYIYCFDKELNEWIRCAEIVMMTSPKARSGENKMNEPQIYASSITYARRVSVQMLLGIACDDDAQIETDDYDPFDNQFIEKAHWENLVNKFSLIEMNNYLKAKGYERMSQVSITEYEYLMNLKGNKPC